METDTQVQQRAPAELQAEPSDVTTPLEVRVSDVDAARSEQNILQWKSYLPEDCVKAMIAMGWDAST